MDSASLSSSSTFSFRCFSRPSLFASRSPQTTLRCSLAGEDSSPNNNNVLAIQDKATPILDCVVVGAGISGLTIAQALSTRHNNNNFILTEARDRAGGNIITVETDGYLWEQGPNSFQPTDPMLTLAVDSGLKDDLVFGDPDAPRFVLWNGKLRPVPSKPVDFPFFDLMSLGGKLRAAFGALGIRPPPPDHEESIEEFVRRNFGDEVFERLIEPFCSGVYAGDPSKLSMKAAFGKVWKLEQNGGSIIGGALEAFRGKSSSSIPTRDPRLPKPKGQTVGSFRKGLAMLPDAISARLGSKLKLSWRLTNIKKLHSGKYCLTYETPGGPITVESKSVVLTVPSHVASSLLQPLSHVAADLLSKFYYPPVAAVSVSYSKDSVRPECLMDGELKGFGQLHPRSQGIETLGGSTSQSKLLKLLDIDRPPGPYPESTAILVLPSNVLQCCGTIYSSSLFPKRAPVGRILLLNYIGGATNPGIISKSESLLVESVDRDLRKILICPDAKDPVVLGVKVWPQAIPQFLIGHFDQLDSTEAALQRDGLQGLFLAGNYVTGVALGKCVEGGYGIATEVTSFLSRYV